MDPENAPQNEVEEEEAFRKFEEDCDQAAKLMLLDINSSFLGPHPQIPDRWSKEKRGRVMDAALAREGHPPRSVRWNRDGNQQRPRAGDNGNGFHPGSNPKKLPDPSPARVRPA